MTRTKIVAALVAVLVIGAGAAAAVPGNAPAGDHAPDSDQRADDTHSSDDAENASEERRGPPADGPAADGPPTGDLPVPDHVSEIHSTIDSFLADDLSGTLGDAISDVVGGEDDAEEPTRDAETAATTADS